MDMDSGTFTAIAAAAVTAATPLATAIKMLWDKVNAQNADTILALKECKEEHKTSAKRYDELGKELLKLAYEVGEFRGQVKILQKDEDARTNHANGKTDPTDN